MGCGGSRADAIEPRYYESWTRETESTWLTNTDIADSPLPATPGEDTQEAQALDKGSVHPYPSTLEEGTQTHARVTVPSSMREKVSADKKTSTIGTNTHKVNNHQRIHIPGSSKQKKHLFRTDERKRDASRTSAKEASSNGPIDTDRRRMDSYVK